MSHSKYIRKSITPLILLFIMLLTNVSIFAKDNTDVTQYRYRDKEFTTSQSKLLDPWVLYNTVLNYKHSGTQTIYLNLSASLDTDKYCVHSKELVYKYIRIGGSSYFYATSSEYYERLRNDPSISKNYYMDTSYYRYTCCESKTSYNVYYYYKWSEWSEWSETSVEATANREVETRTVHVHVYSSTLTEPTCTSQGYTTYICNCGDNYVDDYTNMIEHSWSDWIVMIDPTFTSEGERIRYCTVCKTPKTEKLPVIEVIKPELFTESYNIILTEADMISHIRYASGIYETALEIKNASDRVDLDSSIIEKNITDGILNYKMPDGGIYSLWVKMCDGTTYIMTADLSVMEQEIETHGVTVTVKNLYGVKDYFIAKGEYETYADVKANSVVQITQNKIQDKHDYKYILYEPGRYTVCVRYNDTARPHKFITFDVEVTEPIFTANGLQLNVANIDDVKVIRTAYGEYSTPGEIKRAVGARAFTGKDVLKGLSDYTVQYRENGIVSVAVVYNDGYEVMYTYEVVKKVPKFISSEKTVIIGDLDGLNLVRYAEGEYATSNEIKNALGSKVIKPDSIVGGYIILELEAGTYTFCIQYDDESYNYYTVNIS